VSLPAFRAVVVQVATPGYPLTVLVLQPVFELQVTLPVTSFDFTLPLRPARPFTPPFSPVTVAVNVTDCPYVDVLLFEDDATDVLDVAALMAKLFVCELLDPL
jgi:hypothetical protein